MKFLVGFTNKGDKDFIVETMDASFRYPQDYSFYIQNVSKRTYSERVSYWGMITIIILDHRIESGTNLTTQVNVSVRAYS